MKSWQAELLLFSVTFIWGATFLFTKSGLEYCPPFLFVIFRMTLALIMSLLLFGRHLKGITPRIRKGGIILGLLMGGGFIFQTYGLKFTSVSKSAFITGMAVVLTPFAYWLIERKKVQFWQKAGVMVAAAGLWLFTNPDYDNLNTGDMMTLISTVFWALYITYMDVYTRNNERFSETVQLSVLQFIFTMILCGLAFLVFETKDLSVNFGSGLFISLFFNGIMASFLLTFLHTGVQRFTTPVKAALIFSLEPVIATFMAVIFWGDFLISREIWGASILMLGVALSEFGIFLFMLYIYFLKLVKRIE